MKTLAGTLTQVKEEKRLGFMTHVVVGYPSLEETYELIKTMAEAGVDSIELQIPFSDPMADGSTIMAASESALRGGITPDDCFAFMQRVSEAFPVSFIFMSYFNIVFNYGVQEFVKQAKESGAAGLIIPDASPDTAEGRELYAAAKAADIPLIMVLAPQNDEQRLAELSEHFDTLVYQPLHKGVTGARGETNALLARELELIQSMREVGVVVGFGVSKPEHVAIVKKCGADMVVVGSAVIDVLNKEGVAGVATFLRGLKQML